MKKPFLYLFMSILFFAVCCLQIVKGQQDINLEYIISQNADQPDRIDIHITVLNGTPNFIYRLFDGDYLENGQLIEETQSTLENSYVFRNQPKAEFMICVSDSKGVSICKMVLEPIITNE